MIIVTLFPDSTSHLTLTLTGLGKEPDNNGRYNIHISYFPGNEYSRAGFRTHFLADDLKHNASITVILPSFESAGVGPSEAAIFDWWKGEFIPNREPFSWIGNNCSTIVYRALCVGQERSPALGHRAMVPKSWFCTPGNVIRYAHQLGERLLTTFVIDDAFVLQYQIIKDLCRQISVSPFLSTKSLYKKIKEFNSEKYSLTLNKPFCDGLKQSLSYLRNHLKREKCPLLYDEIAGLTYLEPDTTTVNIDFYFMKIKNIANYIVSHMSAYIDEHEQSGATPALQLIKISLLEIENVFDAALQAGLQTTLMNFFAGNQLHFLETRARITPVLTHLREVVDDNRNPHAHYHQASENIRAIMPGIGLGLSRQY